MGFGASRRAFSLVETIVSVGLLGTCVLLLLGVVDTVLYTSQKSVDMTAGTVFANGLLRQQAYQLLYDPATTQAFFATPHSTPTKLSEGDYQLNGTRLHYRLFVQDLGLGTPLYNRGRPQGMKRLDVFVTWWDESSRHKGVGRLQVFASRLLWPTASY